MVGRQAGRQATGNSEVGSFRENPRSPIRVQVKSRVEDTTAVVVIVFTLKTTFLDVRGMFSSYFLFYETINMVNRLDILKREIQ